MIQDYVANQSKDNNIKISSSLNIAYYTYVFDYKNLKDEDEELPIKHFPIFLDHHVYGKYLQR